MGDKIPVSAQDSTAQLLTPLDLGSRPNGEVEVRAAARHHRRRRWWHRRSVLEKFLLLLVLLLLLGCTALLLNLVLVLYRGQPDAAAAPETRCLTPTCLRVASRVLDRMDPTAEPCQDFFQYACGRYLSSHVVPSDAFYSSNIQHMQERMLVDIKKLIEDNDVAPDIPAVKKVEKLYYSCVNMSSDPSTDVQQSREVAAAVLAELGGWPLLEPGWVVQRFNLTALITRLHSYKVNSVLELFVSSDSRDTSTYIIQLFKGSPLIEAGYLLNQTDQHARRQLAAYRAAG
ncbi:endothelin-converting enzyme 1-like [Pollicipes pollicipes]|uniref:endothelin-converting enzyme 1-like n=1 Tax=Pollicipes pollicipes TaxID=41117 RepID=UPI0018853D9B|nr:endothelin-converting enzyme 1-like [Pollicipes pollicipes]